MSFESVNLFIKDDTASENPISGVVVRVFDDQNVNLITSGTSDASGQIALLLPAPAEYQVRSFKNQVTFTNPTIIDVLENPGATPNDFDISGHVFAPPEAVNPRLCRCSGFFIDVTGAPKANLDIHVISKFDPLILEGDAVMAERVHGRTDSNGYFQIDLIRFGKYEVFLEGLEDSIREIEIPDLASANMPDLIFPVVSSVSFTPAGPWSIGIGSDNDFELTPVVMASDGRTLTGAAVNDLTWSTDDEDVAAGLVTPNVLTLRGVAAGTANLIATRKDLTIITIPDPGISGQPVVITVS
jgi:hypothetical protein